MPRLSKINVPSPTKKDKEKVSNFALQPDDTEESKERQE